jgi:TonB family protein
VTRGVSISVALHGTFLVLFVLFGNFVPQPHYDTGRIMRVRLAPPGAGSAGPALRPTTLPPALKPARVEPKAPKVIPEPDPSLPAKQVPKETKREPKPKVPAVGAPGTGKPKGAESGAVGAGKGSRGPGAGSAIAGTGTGPAVSGTDVDFPFGWYLERIQGIIAGRWNPQELGFRAGSQRRCVVHFFVDRRGQAQQVTLTESSGVSVFDREAQRAVKESKLPPLPPQYEPAALGVSFVFTLEPGT